MIAAGILVAAAATLLAFAGLGMTGHMAAHMGAVAIAAPILAFSAPAPDGGRGRGAGGWRWGDGRSPLLLAMVEFGVAWGWHLPVLRDAADMSVGLALLEQAMFLIVGFLLWRAALSRPAEGVAALLVTSMHMTLLGALIGLADRPLYAMMAMHPAPGLDPVADQQLGGVVMLLVGGASYCLGGLWLLATMLRTRAA